VPSYHFVRFQADAAQIAQFTSWEGAVGRWTTRLAKETVFRQRALQHKKSGAMSAGTHYKKGQWSRGIQFDAGSDVSYAAANDQGARPHKIVAKNAPALVFFWPKVGRVVAFKSVNHPGNKPYDWAMRGLERALRFAERS
jgi:hypothetical protein